MNTIVNFKGVVYRLNNGLWQYKVFAREFTEEDMRDLQYDLPFGYQSDEMAQQAMEYAVRTTAEANGCTLEAVDLIETRERK